MFKFLMMVSVFSSLCFSQFKVYQYTKEEKASYANFAAWLTAAGSANKSFELGEDITITTPTVIPANIDVRSFKNGATFKGSSSLTISKMSAAPAGQIFDTSLTVLFAPGAVSEVRPEWWGFTAFNSSVDNGAIINRAIQSIASNGGRIILSAGVFWIATTINIDKKHLHISGVGASTNDSGGTCFKWNGSVGGTMLTSTGSIVGTTIRNIIFDGQHKTKWIWSVDGLRTKCLVENIVMSRSIGFIYATNNYYATYTNITFRLQTPANVMGGDGFCTKLDWADVCNNAYKAPVCFYSNCNNMRLEKLALSRVGAYEIPTGGYANIYQHILLSGNNIHMILPTWEAIEGESVADSLILGYSSGTKGEWSSQISTVVINNASAANTNSHLLYGNLTNVGSTRTLNLFKDQNKTQLVAWGSRIGDGVMTINAKNGSGLSGQITVSYTGNSTNTNNILNQNYMGTDRILLIRGGSNITVTQAYLEKNFVDNIAEISSLCRGGVEFSKFYIEDCYFSGNLFESGTAHDTKIYDIVGIGVVTNSKQIVNQSTSTQLTLENIEMHNRFDTIGGINYSDEGYKNRGMVSTNSSLPVIIKPKVVTGLTCTQGLDSISPYLLIAPGTIRNGYGKNIAVGRAEQANGLQTVTGWRMRPDSGVANWNVACDAVGCIFIEKTDSLRTSTAHGKIILSTFTTDAAGVISSLANLSTPRCAIGLELLSNGYSGLGTLNPQGDWDIVGEGTRLLIRDTVRTYGAVLRHVASGSNSSSSSAIAHITAGHNLTSDSKADIAFGSINLATEYGRIDTTGKLSWKNKISTTDTTSSTSSATGALVVAGGLGVAKKVYAGADSTGGVVLVDKDGVKWRIKVGTTGTLTAVAD